MNEVMKVKPDELVSKLLAGTATEEERGLALRNMQTYLGASLVDNMEKARSQFAELDALSDRIQKKFIEKVDEALVADTMDKETLFEMLNTLQKNEISFMELQRKIVQSPNKIFGDDMMSSEEKKILMVLKSFKTQQEKEAFIKAVDKAMKDANSFESDEDIK